MENLYKKARVDSGQLLGAQEAEPARLLNPSGLGRSQLPSPAGRLWGGGELPTLHPQCLERDRPQWTVLLGQKG